MIISLDAEKALDKIQYLLMTKMLDKLDIQGNFINLIKAIYEKQLTLYLIVKDLMLSS